MLKMYYCKETERFQVYATQRNCEIKEIKDEIDSLINENDSILEKNGFSYFGYKKSNEIIPVYEANKKRIEKLQSELNEKEALNKINLLAVYFKVNNLRHNLIIDSIKILKDLKLTDVNLTECRKEKISKALINSGAVNPENRIFIYKDAYHISIHASDIEAGIYDSMIEKWEKEKVQILKDSEYLELAENYYNEFYKIKSKINAFNIEIDAAVKEMNTKYEITGKNVYYLNKAKLEDL